MVDKEKQEESVELQDEVMAQDPVVEAETGMDPPKPEELGKLLEDARSKADEHWNMLTRSQAELENLRKRNQRDIENAHKFAIERFSQELLQVWDSLELGHQSAQDASTDVHKLREGTELTLKLLQTVMEKNGVKQIDPQGQPFDPQYHQAIQMQERDDVEPNTVVVVMQKGYTLNDRLIRPAMVIVSRAPAKPVDVKA